MAADRASPLVSKKGPQFEVEYREFCFIGKPIGIVLSAFALVLGIILIIGGIEGRTNNLSLFHAQASWLIENAFELCIIAPALIVAVRGRKFLKPIFCGTLSVRKMIAVGISVGCATCYLSSILGETYFLSEKWNPAGLFNGFKGDLSLTAYLFGPFGEEMFYQVGIQTWLQRFGPFVAVIGTTALFWSVHLTVTDQIGNDLVDNFVVKFGHDKQQSVQIYEQNQIYTFLNSYGGYKDLYYKTNDPFYLDTATGITGLTDTQVQSLTSLLPYQPSETSLLGTRSPGAYYQPNNTFKIQYSNNLTPTTFLTTKYYAIASSTTFDFPFAGEDTIGFPSYYAGSLDDSSNYSA